MYNIYNIYKTKLYVYKYNRIYDRNIQYFEQ